MGSVFRRKYSWVMEYKDQNGKIRRKSAGRIGIITKTAAREILVKTERQIKLGQYDMLDVEIPTLKSFSKEYIKYVRDIIKRRSWGRYEYSLNRLIERYGEKKLSEITPKDIDDFKEVRLRGAKPATVNRELSTLRQIFNLAKRWNKFYGDNPVSVSGLLQEDNMKERILTLEEERRLLVSCGPYLMPIIIFALNTGMRKSEIITLKWSNVDLDCGIVTIDQTNTKAKKTRRVPINPTIKTLLLGQKLKSGRSEYIFLSSSGNPYRSHDSITSSFKKACIKAGIKDFRFHDLRHTAATRMIEAGASIIAVSNILGHSDLKMTMRYAHPDNSLREAVGLLSSNFSDPVTDIFTDIGKGEK